MLDPNSANRMQSEGSGAKMLHKANRNQTQNKSLLAGDEEGPAMQALADISWVWIGGIIPYHSQKPVFVDG